MLHVYNATPRHGGSILLSCRYDDAFFYLHFIGDIYNLLNYLLFLYLALFLPYPF